MFCRVDFSPRLSEIRRARPALTDGTVIEPAVLMVRRLLRLVGIKDGESGCSAARRAMACSNAGPALAPRLLAAFGSQRDRLTSPSQVQASSGIAPVTSRSGDTQRWIHFRWACPKFLRQTFHEFAEHSLADSDWARRFYNQQRGKGPRPSGRRAGPGLQMDPHPVPLLAGTYSLYQADLYRRSLLKRAASGPPAPPPRALGRLRTPAPGSVQTLSISCSKVSPACGNFLDRRLDTPAQITEARRRTKVHPTRACQVSNGKATVRSRASSAA